MNLVDRIKGILLQPKSEWSKIESEPGDAGYLLSNLLRFWLPLRQFVLLSAHRLSASGANASELASGSFVPSLFTR